MTLQPKHGLGEVDHGRRRFLVAGLSATGGLLLGVPQVRRELPPRGPPRGRSDSRGGGPALARRLGGLLPILERGRDRLRQVHERLPLLPSGQRRPQPGALGHEALGRGTRPDVVAALQELSPKQRGAVVLKYWLRYTEREIADALGCSIGSARTHLHRGHSALAATLGDLR